jgi:hypothetical protein
MIQKIGLLLASDEMREMHILDLGLVIEIALYNRPR